MAKKTYSAAEKRSFKNGLLTGLLRSRRSKSKGKASKLTRSNDGHERRMKQLKKREPSNPLEYDQLLIKINYHSACLEKQKKLGRVLTEKEKRDLHNDTVLSFL